MSTRPSIPGASLAEQMHAFLRFLDDLADLVALRMPQLFLAPEVQVSHELTRLRKLLIEEVGTEMEAFAQRGPGARLAPQEVRYLTEVLDFLTAHGWRPALRGGLDLCRLWEQLAAHASTSDEQRRLLIAALSTAEAFADVERIRRKLAELERPT